jgi:pimeloyl-ACP methyl ester carboxylesterase
MFPEEPTRFLEINGIHLAVYERAGVGNPILLAHATSYHAHCWDQVIAHLPPNAHIYAFDARGHGRSTQVPPPANWFDFGNDVITLIDLLDLRNVIAAGHSMGGHALVQAAAARPERFAGVLLIDPVIFPEAMYSLTPLENHPAARRRNDWASPEEMYERFKDREPFSRWKPGVLHDYCAYGLLRKPGGEGYVLACSPAFEASNYEVGLTANIYDRVAKVKASVTVLRSGQQAEGMNLSASPTAPDLASHFSRAQDVVLREYSHFIPMEAPELTAQYLQALWETAPIYGV